MNIATSSKVACGQASCLLPYSPFPRTYQHLRKRKLGKSEAVRHGSRAYIPGILVGVSQVIPRLMDHLALEIRSDFLCMHAEQLEPVC